MNANIRNLLSFFVAGLIAINLFWPNTAIEKEVAKPSRLDQKCAPSDHFFLRYAFPDEAPDVKGYTKAMKMAGHQMSQRNAALPGFDTPWTQRGPGDAGARINAIAVHPVNEQIMIAGFSAGGIFKTTDGGNNWYPVFDDQPYLAIGDIIFDPSHPDTVYAGTGDPNITSYPFIGDGVFRSTDAGETWTNIGLNEEGIVSKMAVDPTNSDIIYVSTMGLPFIRSTRRGLYKTIDGGTNWTQILQLSDSTGVIDFLLNPDNPQILYAAGWDRIRNNSESIVEGMGARIHKSIDGGDTWTELGNGLPTGTLSRIGLAMSGSNPDHIFALVVALVNPVDPSYNLEGIYKSIDGGDNWTELPTDVSTGLSANALGGFGWYFGKLIVDPNNEARMHILGVQVWSTTSSGFAWTRLTQMPGGPPPHPDHHDMIFTAASDLILATDGGLYRLPSGTTVWNDLENIPATQFYRVGYNPHEPDNFYGGTQDNGTQQGTRGEVVDWERIFGGDGFQTAFHPTDPDVAFVETQNGNIWASTDGGNSFQYGSNGIVNTDPRSWDMQFIISPHNPDILYTGTHRLYVSTGGGIPAWTPVSGILSAPDGLSDGRFHVITTLSESPLDSGLLYVGTSDAKVRRKNSSDGLWIDITPGLPNRYVTDVVASPDDPAVVFISHSGYKDADYIPHIHRSDNRGATWQDISGDLPPLAINDLFIMPGYSGQVVFVATDGGVYSTLNGGAHWERLGLGMPLVAVYDMAYNETYNELTAGTHARSIFTFPLDSIGVSNMPLAINIAGNILTETGQAVNAVDISNGQATTMTDGTYQYNAFSGTSCSVVPDKNTNARNGVSILDLVLVQRNLLFLDTLDSPYKLIAADVNKSGSISITDLVLMQRMILFIDNEFNNNTSWRFIPSDYTFLDPEKPLSEDFPEVYDCGGATGDLTGVDFVALKVGDVSGNASPNAASGGSDRLSENALLTLQYEDQVFEAGSSIDLVLNVDTEKPLLGIQAALDIDASYLEIITIQSGTNDVEIPGDLNWNIATENTLRLLWNEALGQVRGAEIPIITLRLKAKKSGRLSELIHLNAAEESIAIIGNKNAVESIAIELETLFTTDTNPSLNTNDFSATIFPNPFATQTQLQITATQKGMGQIQIFNSTGQELFQHTMLLNPGIHLFEIKDHLLSGKGLYYVKVKQEGQGSVLRRLLFQ